MVRRRTTTFCFVLYTCFLLRKDGKESEGTRRVDPTISRPKLLSSTLPLAVVVFRDYSLINQYVLLVTLHRR